MDADVKREGRSLFYSPAASTLTKSEELEPECPEIKDECQLVKEN